MASVLLAFQGDAWLVLILQVVDLKGNEGVELHGLAYKGRQCQIGFGWRGEHKGEYDITRQGRTEASKAE